jgi:hypothetical protein
MNFRDYIALTLQGVRYAGAHWGQRVFGTVGLFADAIAEGERQAFYQSLIGHTEQAEDSLLQATADRGLWRFLNETKAVLAARVADAWTDYERQGTPQQMLRAVDQWGSARYPDTWVNDTCTLTESEVSTLFTSELFIPYGMIDPFTVNVYGGGGVYGAGLIYGYDAEGNFVDLYRIVKKWKPARSKVSVVVERSIDISGAAYTGDTFSFASEESSVQGIFFKPDGLKMYVVGSSGDAVYPYTLGTSWDVTTAVYDGASFSVAAQDTAPREVFLKPDGLKMYVVGATGVDVNPYTLGTAWDVTTAVYDGASFNVSAQDTVPTGLFFKPDGTRMFVVGETTDTLYSYTLGTAWDVTTAVYDGLSFSVAAQEAAPSGVFFEPDMLTAFVVGSSPDSVYTYGVPSFYSTLEVA